MSVYENNINMELERLLSNYIELDAKLHFSVEDEDRYNFTNQYELITTIVECRKIITQALKLHTYIMENKIEPLDYEHTRDLYKRSQIKVTYAIIYHDLKNVFEILDISVSEKSNNITIQSITTEDLENIYVTVVSFVLQTAKAYGNKVGIGGAKKHEPKKRWAAS